MTAREVLQRIHSHRGVPWYASAAPMCLSAVGALTAQRASRWAGFIWATLLRAIECDLEPCLGRGWLR
jgi:hypothetical protein